MLRYVLFCDQILACRALNLFNEDQSFHLQDDLTTLFAERVLDRDEIALRLGGWSFASDLDFDPNGIARKKRRLERHIVNADKRKQPHPGFFPKAVPGMTAQACDK